MGKEDEIRNLLQQGYTPKSVIGLGYPKSTVYKVAATVQTFTNAITEPVWSVENINSNKGIFDDSNPRFLPGQQMTLNYDFVNKSPQDMYVKSLGVQTEWMIREGIWWSQNVGDVLRPGQRRHVTLSFPVPVNLPLGEYEVSFGVEGQFLPVQGYSGPIQTQWSNPLILHVRHPMTGQVIFLSHSVQDIRLVRELERQLLDRGIKVLIGEDEHRPGAELEEKFQQMIRSSTIFVALLTEPAARSEWVIKETKYALSINKPCILLKEESVTGIQTSREWTPFSLSGGPVAIFQTLMSTIERLNRQPGVAVNGAGIGTILGVGLLAFLIGLAAGREE
jgi:hypothetical protein